VEWIKASFSGEDFCEFSERKPSCYFMLGVGLEGSLDEHTRESKFPIHSNKFKLDETALLRGAKLWERIAMFEGPSIQP
jgi:amidohydrolase